MPGEESTTKLNVDISELKKAMQEAKRSVAVANSEFQATASTMDDWSKSTDGISAKLKQLNTNVNSQKTILKNLEAQYAAVAAEQGESSKAAQDLEIKINKQKATINNTEREISKFEDSLEEVSKAEKIAASTGKEVSEVLDEMGNEAEDAEGGFTVLKGAIATFAGNVMTGLVSSIKDGIMNLAGLAEETREYRNEMAKLDTAFTTNGHNAEAANQTYKDLYAILGDEGQAVEAANFLAKLTDNEKDLANWTNIAAGVYGAFGNSLPIEGLTEAANETAKVGQVTGPLADALNWAGVSEDKFNESLAKCSSEQERQKLIMDTLNGLYSESASKFKETNASVIEANEANAKYQDTLAELGAKIEPVTTAVKTGFTELLQSALDLISGMDMEAFTAKIEEGFAVLKDDVLPAIKDGFKWILDNKDALIAGIAGIAGGFVAFKAASLISTAVTAFKSYKAAQEGATVAQWLFNAAMNANPIMLIVTVIAAVVTAIATFIATNDDARAKFMEIWQGVKDFFAGIWEGICKFFTETIPNAFNSFIGWIKTNWQSILTFLINPFAGLFKYFYDNNSKFKEWVDNAITYIKELPGKVWTWLSNTMLKVGEWIVNMLAKAKEVGTKFVSNVIDFFKELPGKVWTWLVNVVSKVTSWIANMLTKAKEVGTKFVTTIIDFYKELPGKVWTWLVNVVSKVATWVSNMATKAKEAGTKFINNVVDTIQSLPGKVWNFLTDIVSKVVTWGSNLAAKGKQAATDLFNAIVNKVKEIPEKMASVGLDIVKGIGNGITNGIGWLKDKITSFVGDVTSFIKKVFKIGSPSRLMRDEVGVWIARGIAVGIEHGAKYAKEALSELSGDLLESEKHYQLESERLEKEKTEKEYQTRLANAKDAAEIEQIKQERIQKEAEEAEKAYLDGLKATADKERSIFDQAVSGIESFIDDAVDKLKELDNLQKSISDTLKGEGNLTYSTISIIGGGADSTFTKLADVGADNKTLEKYNSMLDELTERRGVMPVEVAGYLSEMGLADGMQYVEAMLNASDEEFNKYIDALAEKTRLSEEISQKVTTSQVKQLTTELTNGMWSVVDTFDIIGESGAVSFGEGFMSNMETVLHNIKSMLSSTFDSLLNGDSIRSITSNVSDVLTGLKSRISGVNATISGGNSGGSTSSVVNNFTQVINSPTTPSRLDLYRNTKNLLGLAGGVA